MAGTIRFDSIPRLPQDWWDKTDAESVWPTWGQHTSYLWGANSGNQFLARGVALNGEGLASSNGPSRGRAHPQYVGIDTMSGDSRSLKANNKVYAQMTAYLKAGNTLIVPVDLRASQPDPGKFSLGTGYGLTARDGTKIHLEMWVAILELIKGADTVSYCATMWTPDISQPVSKRKGSRVALPDLESIKAYHAKLLAAETAVALN